MQKEQVRKISNNEGTSVTVPYVLLIRISASLNIYIAPYQKEQTVQRRGTDKAE